MSQGRRGRVQVRRAEAECFGKLNPGQHQAPAFTEDDTFNGAALPFYVTFN